jgi:hypothetical protein
LGVPLCTVQICPGGHVPHWIASPQPSPTMPQPALTS